MRRVIAAIGLFLLPIAVFAASETRWDLRSQAAVSGWRGKGVTVDMTTAGMRLRAQGGGHVLRATEGAKIDVIEITYLSPAPVSVFLLWAEEGAANGAYVQFPFDLETAVDKPKTITLQFAAIEQWNPNTPALGFLFPDGGEVFLQDIVLKDYNVFNSVVPAFKSFWSMDFLRPHTVNFLYGPLLAFTDAGQAQIYDSLPARGMSANVVMYGIIVLGFCVLLALGWLRKIDGNKVLIGTAALIGVLWLAHDVRMTSEFGVYVARDLQGYWLQEPGDRTYREHGSFYDFMLQVTPLLQKYDRYAFVSPNQHFRKARIGYTTYPTLVMDATTVSQAPAWVIDDTSNFTVDEAGRLLRDGQVVASGGTITLQYDEDSFLYETTP